MTVLRVAIGIVQDKGRILICRRPINARLGGYWEFPGGKCRADESPEECVSRELQEEVGLTVEAARALPVIEHDYEDGPIRLYPFVCRVLGGEARAMAADELRWVSAAELSRYQFPAANERLIRTLMEGKGQAEV